MRKFFLLLLLFMPNGREAFSGGLPWPAVDLDRLYLPLDWCTEGNHSGSSVEGYISSC